MGFGGEGLGSRGWGSGVRGEGLAFRVEGVVSLKSRLESNKKEKKKFRVLGSNLVRNEDNVPCEDFVDVVEDAVRSCDHDRSLVVLGIGGHGAGTDVPVPVPRCLRRHLEEDPPCRQRGSGGGAGASFEGNRIPRSPGWHVCVCVCVCVCACVRVRVRRV